MSGGVEDEHGEAAGTASPPHVPNSRVERLGGFEGEGGVGVGVRGDGCGEGGMAVGVGWRDGGWEEVQGSEGDEDESCGELGEAWGGLPW